jgi:hypothetical protein
MMSEKTNTGYATFIWLMVFQEKRFAKLQWFELAAATRLPKIYFIDSWLLWREMQTSHYPWRRWSPTGLPVARHPDLNPFHKKSGQSPSFRIALDGYRSNMSQE